MQTRDWLIAASPPTPNGDLHVGHIAGPYLSSDVFRRARQRLGDTAAHVSYADDNQSYVVTTARRRGLSPEQLMDHYNQEIQATLAAFDIALDSFARPDDGQNAAVGEAVRTLVAAGLVVEKQVPELYDGQTQTPLYESFVSGGCNVCLRPTKGGVCEACGHPNDPVDLLGPRIDTRLAHAHPTGETRRLVLPVEDYREELLAYYREKRGRWRPHVLQLVDEVLAHPLPDYPISHPGSWGIPVGLPGWENNVVNVWAEIGLAFLHQLARHRDGDALAQGSYVQFLGFDNSYAFAVAHPVLQFALERAGAGPAKVPDTIFTNEFYHLEHRKFSTSQGHAIWARDLLDHMSADEARFYLSLHAPELAEGNFELDAAHAALQRDLHVPLATVRARLSEIANSRRTPVASVSPSVLDAVDRRVRLFSAPESFSVRGLAGVVRDLLAYLAAVELDPGDPSEAGTFLACLSYWADVASIVMPKLAAEVASQTASCARASEAAPAPVR
jgi:methionyl-tRNA synthetase